jgi:predicted RND superfamily exporter protein
MGWTGMLVDIGAVITIGMALGIAVDDTFHFMVSFRRARAAGLSQVEAVESTFEECGVAMVQTALILSLALLPYMFSGFVPSARFGVLMCITLLIALTGDLVLLPALLMGFTGRRLAPAARESEANVPESVSVVHDE